MIFDFQSCFFKLTEGKEAGYEATSNLEALFEAVKGLGKAFLAVLSSSSDRCTASAVAAQKLRAGTVRCGSPLRPHHEVAHGVNFCARPHQRGRFAGS